MSTSPQYKERSTPHVLVVDDEEEICQMVAICLKQAGIRISTAGNAADAFNLLVSEPCDVIVTDVMMPGEDGVSFLGRVHQSWPDIPVILMTGYAQLDMAVCAIKNGAFDFVQKPFDYGYMCKIVERAVNYSKLQTMEKNYRAELEETVTRRTTELKNAVVELDFAKTLLLKTSNEKNEFMSNVTHEMRTPMNGVMGGLSLLEDEVTTASGMEYLEIVRQSADRMVAMIDQLLTFGSGIARCTASARYDLINLQLHINALIDKCRPSFAQKGILLKLRIAVDVPREIWTDIDFLSRLLEILLGNALKFTDKGVVALEVVHENNTRYGGRLYFSLIDSGIGIPQGMLERIFEPFVQGDGTYTRRYEGVGLGLSIARQMAENLNGSLWAEHESGGGSRFTFSNKLLPTDQE